MINSLIRSPLLGGKLARDMQFPLGLDWENPLPGSLLTWPEEFSVRGFAVDIEESDSEYRVLADLPGVDKENLEVSVKDNVLSIAVKSPEQQSEIQSESRSIRKERYQGQYSRTFKLGSAADSENIQASYKDGVLNISVPKKATHASKVIEVSVN